MTDQPGRKINHLPTITGLPDWMHDLIRQADNLFIAARAAALAGDPRRAAELRDQAERIYNEIEARYFVQPGQADQPPPGVAAHDPGGGP